MTIFTVTCTCTRCKKIKPDDRFKLCERCRAKMRQEYYSYRQEKEKVLIQWMSDMKSQMSCTDCGASYPDEPKRLAWDHLPGEIKITEIADMCRHSSPYTKEDILAEIQKCELVCFPCHVKRGLARGQIPTGPQGESTCQYCQRSFKHRKGAKRKYCSGECASKGRTFRLKIHKWRPPKPDLPKPLPWWETTPIIEGDTIRR